MKIIIYITIPLLIIILRFQYFNWKKYRSEGNGANLTRIALMINNVAGLLICAGILLHDFLIVALAVSVMPSIKLLLYWPAIKEYFTELFQKNKPL